ncbi:MAG: hypothetical protein DI526_15135, partial [Caulobacter segnis]
MLLRDNLGRNAASAGVNHHRIVDGVTFRPGEPTKTVHALKGSRHRRGNIEKANLAVKESLVCAGPALLAIAKAAG